MDDDFEKHVQALATRWLKAMVEECENESLMEMLQAVTEVHARMLHDLVGVWAADKLLDTMAQLIKEHNRRRVN